MARKSISESHMSVGSEAIISVLTLLPNFCWLVDAPTTANLDEAKNVDILLLADMVRLKADVGTPERQRRTDNGCWPVLRQGKGWVWIELYVYRPHYNQDFQGNEKHTNDEGSGSQISLPKLYIKLTGRMFNKSRPAAVQINPGGGGGRKRPFSSASSSPFDQPSDPSSIKKR